MFEFKWTVFRNFSCRAVGSNLKVVQPENVGYHCGRGFFACKLHVAENLWDFDARSLLLVASQCTGSCSGMAEVVGHQCLCN